MTKTLPKLVLSSSRDIPFSQLVLSQKNVRRVKAGLDTQGEQRQAEAGVPAARAQIAASNASGIGSTPTSSRRKLQRPGFCSSHSAISGSINGGM